MDIRSYLQQLAFVNGNVVHPFHTCDKIPPPKNRPKMSVIVICVISKVTLNT